MKSIIFFQFIFRFLIFDIQLISYLLKYIEWKLLEKDLAFICYFKINPTSLHSQLLAKRS